MGANHEIDGWRLPVHGMEQRRCHHPRTKTRLLCFEKSEIKEHTMKLMKGEEMLMEIRPEPKLLVIWFFTRCLSIAILAGIIGFLLSAVVEFMHEFGTELKLFSAESDFDGWSIAVKLTIAVISGAIGFFIAFVYCYFLKRTYVYAITSRRCIFSGGILRHVRHSVPYHKITDVEMSQNIIERMLGISSLGIYTPGTGSMSNGGSGRRPEIAFVGLKDNETPAETINSILSNFKAIGQ
jgi:uncharacterized membrane protein YdbT with pleckstrin-like domain